MITRVPQFEGKGSMRRGSLYDRGARKQTVSLSINADLFAQAKEAKMNVSRVAEEALAAALTAQVRQAMQEDIIWIEAYEAGHGSFPEMMRAFEEEGTDAEAI